MTTVTGLQSTMTKDLVKIKGVTEAKVCFLNPLNPL